MSIPTTTVTSTTAVSAASDAEPASEFGATVQDAQRLLRRAKYCYVFVRVGSNIGETELLDVPKRVIAAELKRRPASNRFPCELYSSPAGGWNLMFGTFTAIEAAEARR